MNGVQSVIITIFPAISVMFILVMAELASIKKELKKLGKTIDDCHLKILNINDKSFEISRYTKTLPDLARTLDAKKNFIEGLNYGKYEEVKE